MEWREKALGAGLSLAEWIRERCKGEADRKSRKEHDYPSTEVPPSGQKWD